METTINKMEQFLNECDEYVNEPFDTSNNTNQKYRSEVTNSNDEVYLQHLFFKDERYLYHEQRQIKDGKIIHKHISIGKNRKEGRKVKFMKGELDVLRYYAFEIIDNDWATKAYDVE